MRYQNISSYPGARSGSQVFNLSGDTSMYITSIEFTIQTYSTTSIGHGIVTMNGNQEEIGLSQVSYSTPYAYNGTASGFAHEMQDGYEIDFYFTS